MPEPDAIETVRKLVQDSDGPEQEAILDAAIGAASETTQATFLAAVRSALNEDERKERTNNVLLNRDAVRHAERIETEADFGSAIKRMPPRRKMSDLLATEPPGMEALVWEPDMMGTHVLARRGTVIRLGGGFKAGKSSIMASYCDARITGSSFLGLYQVEKAPDDSVIVILDAEQDESDIYAMLHPYLGSLPPDQQNRIVVVPLRGVRLDILNEHIRNEIEKQIRAQMLSQCGRDDLPIADLIFDPFFQFMPKGREPTSDALLGGELYSEAFVGWGQQHLGAENVIVCAHMSGMGSKLGGEAKTFGSIGFDAAFQALWAVQRESANDDGPRVFVAQQARRRTGAPPILVHFDEKTSRLVADPETLAEARSAFRDGKKAAEETADHEARTVRTTGRIVDVLKLKAMDDPSKTLSNGDIEREMRALKDSGEDVHVAKAEIASVLKPLESSGTTGVKNLTPETDRGGRKKNRWVWAEPHQEPTASEVVAAVLEGGGGER